MEKLASFLQDYRVERKHFLETRIKKELQDLDMPDADFEIEVKEGPFDQRGCSDVRFLFSPNKGEHLKSMNSIASGGEISRVMLAVRTIFTEFDRHSLLMLDELDTGVSGAPATMMSAQMELRPKARPVLVISAPPQAAVVASNPLYVTKKTADDRAAATDGYHRQKD